ncbi:SusD/RagB family nutrient-binding outer membrane lipoprotein [Chitinophaga japonensis]|uniref:SusD-like starch-binding protein associating with outer membrane n=1 Tax=Chitinophaga japonensis TaxID=104662 RepID=A0A562TD86_CHIJA|nr:SusD/RagB family nutrient-binding outer membrane lipoprotein [Chitinophaga japonensis]TWI91036.1 SusD-like starch-binding protein associating with outer membrane [Chitinophaga japonensis]
MNRILFIIAAAVCLFTGSCKKFIDVNEDPNRPTAVGEAAILAPAELAISHGLHGGNAAIIVQEYLQVIALNQPVPNAGTYFMQHTNIDVDWTTLYATCLNNLVRLDSVASVNGNSNYRAIARVLQAYCLGFGTDLWGDIPYTQALQGEQNFTPAYDEQAAIYDRIQALLDGAIADIAQNSAVVPGGDDYFYGGDMSKWEKLAYTLKARYYMHLTKAPGHSAATQAGLALAALEKGMASGDDDLKFDYDGIAGQENVWYSTFLSASTLILASGFVDTLKAHNDPRLSKMVKPAAETGLYTGRQIGDIDVGSLEAYSRPTDFYQGAAGNNYIVIYLEALFLKAEATLIQSGAAAAEPIYQEAIRTHMEQLGVSGSDITTYLTARGTLTAANALQRIMEEKKVANFLSVESFTDWRRTGYPVMIKVPNALSEIPRRLLYPQAEIVANPQPEQDAVLTDRVWWDQ